MISQETIDKVFETANIEDIIRDFVELKKSGANYKGLSPFSDEKTPSFVVSPAKQIWKDFSSGKGGNFISFLMEHAHMSYPEAITHVAKKYNIDIIENITNKKKFEEKSHIQKLYEVNSAFNEIFKSNLIQSQKTLDYLRKRGFDKNIIEKFEIGLGCNQNEKEFEKLKEKGLNLNLIEELGIIIKNKNTSYNRFKNRIIFPIHDGFGKISGFAGRIQESSNNSAKYINSQESLLYKKSEILYGYFLAKNEIAKADNCYVVEGYTDVISLYQADIKNVVSCSGTSFTEKQIRKLSKITKNITVVYDSDKAGIDASKRSINMILNNNMNVQILPLPQGDDPDSFSKKNSKNEIKEYFENKKIDFIEYELNYLQKEKTTVNNINSLNSIIKSISVIPNELTRSIYIKELSEKVQIEKEIIFNQVNKVLNNTSTKNIINNKKEEKTHKISEHELDIIKIMINYSKEKIKIKNQEINVISFIKKEINNQYKFENQTIYHVFNEILSRHEKHSNFDIQKFLSNNNSEINSLLSSLMIEDFSLSSGWEKYGIQIRKYHHNLKKIVIGTINTLKMTELNNRIKAEQLKISTDPNDNIATNNLIKLQKARAKMSKESGRFYFN
tara:strand:- start:1143 stop:2987 length:1845 start_codon:yes stop_codon:yes gene_type:complete